MNIFSRISPANLARRTNRKWRDLGAGVLPLWVADMDVPTPPEAKEEADFLFSKGDLGYISHLDEQTYLDAYRRFAHRHWKVDLDVRHARVISDVISGMRAVIERTLGHRPNRDATATGPGGTARWQGTVVALTPAYPRYLGRLAEGYRLEAVPLVRTRDSAELLPDFPALNTLFESLKKSAPPTASLTGYNTVLVMASPNNPTGTVYPADILRRLALVCERWHVRLLVDEIFSPLVRVPAETMEEDPSTRFVPILSLAEAQSAISVFSATKTYAMPSLPASVLLAGEDPDCQDLLAGLTRSDVERGTHLGALVQAYCLEKSDAWLEEVVEGLLDNERLLRSLVADLLPKARLEFGKGTYLAFLDLTAYARYSQADGDVAGWLLEKAKVGVNPGADYGGRDWGNWVLVNIATNPEVLEAGIRRIAAAVTQL